MTNNTTNMGSASTVSNSGHLADYEFLPAVIVETDDPMKYGRIKVSALGAYNANNSSPAQLPWCYPFMMQGNNTYASYEKGSKVWLLRNTKRQDENWFIPMYEHHAMTQQFVDGANHSDKPEVISMRNNGGSQSSITYDHGGGYNISTGGGGGGASVNVGTGSTASISGGGSSVSTSGDGVNLGAPGEDAHPAALGDKTVIFLCNAFSLLIDFAAELIEKDPLTKDACILLLEGIIELFSGPEIYDIMSNKVMINETLASDEAARAAEAAEKAAAEKKAADKKSGKEKLMKGEELTEDEYNALDSWDQSKYTANQLQKQSLKGTYFDPDVQKQWADYSAQFKASQGQPQQSQQAQQNQTYRQQNVAVSDNTSIYNRPTPPPIEVRTYPIPTNNQIPIGGVSDPNFIGNSNRGNGDPYNAEFRQGPL